MYQQSKYLDIVYFQQWRDVRIWSASVFDDNPLIVLGFMSVRVCNWFQQQSEISHPSADFHESRRQKKIFFTLIAFAM